MSSSPFEFRVLGPLEVVRLGRMVGVGTPQMRELLALLVLDAGRVVTTDRLVEEMWGDRPPAQPLVSVQTYVSRLRLSIGGDVLATRGRGYVLSVDADAVDARRFERLAGSGRAALREGRQAEAADVLEQALALWRGSALEDLRSRRAEAEAARLNELRLVTLEERVEADLASGRANELAGELEALTAEHPLRERLWALRMLALYRAGRQADALQAFARVRTILAEELGIDPGAELRSLEERVLLQHPSLDVATGVASVLAVPEPRDETLPSTSLRVRSPGVEALVPLARRRVTLGRGPGNDVVIDDPRVSATHAVIELLGPVWCVRDVGSRNGTWLNGERVTGDRVIRPDDEIVLGSTRVTLTGDVPSPGGTIGVEPPPALIPRQRRVLVELCRPVFAGAELRGPATPREIASALDITEDEARAEIGALCDAFGIPEATAGRRARLASLAVERGAVTIPELR